MAHVGVQMVNTWNTSIQRLAGVPLLDVLVGMEGRGWQWSFVVRDCRPSVSYGEDIFPRSAVVTGARVKVVMRDVFDTLGLKLVCYFASD